MTLQSSNDTKINSGNLVINGANQWIETPSTGNISHVDDETGKSGQHYSTDKSMNFFIDQKGSSTDFRSYNFYEGGSDIEDSSRTKLMEIDELSHVMIPDNHTSVGDFYDVYEVTPQGNEDAIIVKGVDDPSDDASLVLQGREDSGTGDQIADLSFHNKETNVASLNAKENNEINIKGGKFHVRTDNGMKLHGEMDANSNDINDVRYTNHTVQSGNLNTCDSTWEGATAYNGTHWGCDGSNWNKLY